MTTQKSLGHWHRFREGFEIVAIRKEGDLANELESLAEECNFVAEFLKAFEGFPGFYVQFQEVVRSTLKRGDIRGMRMLARDLTQMVRSLRTEDQEKLEQLMRSRHATSIGKVAEADRELIRKILVRGKVESDDEFRLLESHVDDIYADDSKQEELEQINSLLVRYEEAKALELGL